MNSEVLRFPSWTLSMVLFCASVTADGLDSWHWRNPVPTADSARSVTFGNGKFVAVGERGLALSSPNGVDWELVSSTVSNSLNRVTFAEGLFVSVGDGGVILTSADGETWTARDSTTTNHLLAVAHGNGLFMAVGSAGTVLISTNTVTWQNLNSGVNHDLDWVTYGNELFMLPGSPTNLAASVLLTPDGNSWSASTIVSNAASTLFQATYSGVEFVAYLNKTEVPFVVPYFYTSTNGTDWVQRANATWAPVPSTSPNSTFGFLAAANGHVIEVEWRPPDDVAADTWISISPDAQVWTNTIIAGSNSIYTTYYGLSDAAYGNDKYVIVGAHGVLLSSNNSTNWTLNTRGARTRITGMAVGKGVCAAVGGGVPVNGTLVPDRQINGYPAPILVSSNGSTFDIASSPSIQMLTRVAFGAGVFVAVGDGGAMQRSTDAVTWTLAASGTTKDILSVCRGSNLWVAVAADGTIISSPTALAWTTRNSGTGYHLYGVTYGNGLYVAVGYFGIATTSPDGIDWTVQYTGTTNTLFNVAYGNGMFVAVGENGAIVTSNDGENWSVQPPATSLRLYGLAYGAGRFVAVGANPTGQIPTDGNVVLSSYDGATWKLHNLPTGLGVYSVSFQTDSFWVSGEYGTVLQSDEMPSGPLLQGRLVSGNSEFELKILGEIPAICRIQMCTNLVADPWYDVATLTNATSPYTWIENASGLSQLYRLVSP